MKKISGTFKVNMLPADSVIKDEGFGRFELQKSYSGELEAESHGEMLSFRTAIEGSAGYVAIELLTANLAGLEGEFALQHFGLMSAEGQSLQLLVVPDSGTDELMGLSGRMGIRIEAGVHYYDFEYEFKA